MRRYVPGPAKICGGKRRYLFRSDAERAVLRFRSDPKQPRWKRERMGCYRCPKCGFYHLGKDREPRSAPRTPSTQED